MRYIELSPVRANMVAHPAGYSWFSYRCNAPGEEKGLITPREEYLRLGETWVVRQAAYRQLFKHHIAESRLAEIREATNKARVLGNEHFRQRIQQQLARRLMPSAKGGDRKSEKYRAGRV